MSERITTVKEYFERLGERFVASAAKGVQAIFQFDISGPHGGVWHVVVNDGAMEVCEGKHPKPSATVTATDDDYVQIANGDINGLRAVMTRRMKVAGNLVMARKMQYILPTGNI